MKKEPKTFILGAGMTGLSAGHVSGLPVFEAQSVAGGICTSYYMKPGDRKRMFSPPKDGNAYHFEIGGGHWIFGGNPDIKKIINRLAPFNIYERKSSVYLPAQKILVPYPLQNHLSFLGRDLADKAAKEILNPKKKRNKAITMKDWLEINFGKTLSRIFFHPFHELYTAGLSSHIAPQDSYKTPINIDDVKKGYQGKLSSVGYNTTFGYPKNGLDHLTRKLAEKCDIRYGKKVIKIDLKKKLIFFEDKKFEKFKTLISTLPLNVMAKIAGVNSRLKPFPSPSVLVVNIGAIKGPHCPDDHWVYVPQSASGFHRVGFYSHIDSMFLPKKYRRQNDRVSIYVEKAYPEGVNLSKKEMDQILKSIIKELQDWQWIGKVEVFDPTWIQTAYTWSWPGSDWKENVLKELEAHDVFQVGRYGRWSFQGIADSIEDGFEAGRKFS